jgi:hypothetical protein
MLEDTDERIPWMRAAIEGSPLPIRFDDDNAIVARYVDSECAAVLWIFDATPDFAHLDDEVHWGRDLIVCDRTPSGDLERFANVLGSWHGPPGEWPPETFSVGRMGIRTSFASRAVPQAHIKCATRPRKPCAS